MDTTTKSAIKKQLTYLGYALLAIVIVFSMETVFFQIPKKNLEEIEILRIKNMIWVDDDFIADKIEWNNYTILYKYIIQATEEPRYVNRIVLKNSFNGNIEDFIITGEMYSSIKCSEFPMKKDIRPYRKKNIGMKKEEYWERRVFELIAQDKIK